MTLILNILYDGTIPGPPQSEVEFQVSFMLANQILLDQTEGRSV